MSIEEMVPSGVWLAEGGTGTPQYVVNPDHITRLQNEGYQPVADPRIPQEFSEPEKGSEQSEEPQKDEEQVNDDTNGRLTAVNPDTASESSTGSVDTTA